MHVTPFIIQSCNLFCNLYLFVSFCYWLVIYFYFTYFVDVSDCVKHSIKHGKHYFSLLRILYEFQWIYCQQKRLFVIGVKYKIAEYTQCIIGITNTAH